ncbi:hypothetical protein ASPNIDRAFT_176564 [Aspergillus niger ATCC 1015]|uniref:Uncharacterized protein n=1 Tax=Aspergillus niger (strain ATCC 1015 / CBS 113.46 / FGSC A1144 / LSHB Ac4 / NCTC 3858a / NRRL 328 / USDA 3528.7) TaxID=380704 RepID=G3YG96_ASPNA|nr:hypothetical protein ASPNIDRAFT_176564 [Aspergillus niger ATCC 1015]
MAPFRNFLSRKSTAPNGGEVSAAPNDNSASQVSLDTHGSSPLSFRKSSENEPPEYKLSVSHITSTPSTLYSNLSKQPEAMEEEQYEEVALDDEEVKPKRKSIFSRFGDFTNDSSQNSSTTKSSTLGFHIPGRKRGPSNVGSELGTFKAPPANAESEVHDA